MDRKIPVTSVKSGKLIEAAPGIHQYTNQVVNLFFVKAEADPGNWVLIDAGMPSSAEQIIEQAEKLFGKGARPKAIYLTHGHFDHIGSLETLIKAWDVPVYAHTEEFPYLTGQLNYPEPDPNAGRGMVVKLSPYLFPNEGIDISGQINVLPEDHELEHLPGWHWIHTPGHTPGHVSYYHHSSKIMIAGDALITVKQESLFNVLTQKKELDGPPDYLTQDQVLAGQSIRIIRDLKPKLLLTGHGMPMTDEEFSSQVEDVLGDE
ncbi:MBL fold metallo-hydrolase [Jeotgalibacillus terrae]|uniref:MBL fold metallo-hydrolase n=1 Tax=Jeotgalibacillus terrae TaxID=587735 RepID=A0ABW5ZCS9_9BACL|nr:MBL fold metallo-hydrolase [Jeotgalibacillus terrae]MBM7579099.1 glyoxylase-like metal-dependent hydrolase (beta-lactamase superfamily II) [Jeotgalibacillus terrae]